MCPAYCLYSSERHCLKALLAEVIDEAILFETLRRSFHHCPPLFSACRCWLRSNGVNRLACRPALCCLQLRLSLQRATQHNSKMVASVLTELQGLACTDI